MSVGGFRRWHHTHQRLRHSLKWRLVLLFLLLALAVTVVFLGGLQRVMQTGWQDFAKPLVSDYLDRLAADIGSPPDPQRAQALVERLPLSIRIEGPAVQYDSNPQRTARRLRWLQSRGEHHEFDPEDWGLTRSTADGHRIIFGLGDGSMPLHGRTAGWLTLGALLLVTLLAFIYVRRLLRPLDDIRAGTQRFGQGDFSHPIVPRRRDELGDMAQQINRMASSLHAMLEAKRTLLLAISHELRSPLTRARVNAELVEEGEARQALLNDLGEMRDLITDLLESERLASGHAALQAEPTDLPALVREVARSAAEPGVLTLQLDPMDAPTVVDPTRIRLLLRNLIDNALRHSAGAEHPPEVFLRRRL